MIQGIKSDFDTVYNNGTVVEEHGYHQPDKEGRCECENTTRKGSYKYVFVNYNGRTYYFYHQSAVVIALDDGREILDNHGYYNKSTKAAMNQYTTSDIKLYSEDCTWYVDVGSKTFEFSNRMVVHSETETIER